MTKKMLVKTESVDMTWGVAGRGGGFWGVMSEERESWCKGRDVNESFLKKQKKAMFSFLLKCHFNRVKKKPSSSFFTHTHTQTSWKTPKFLPVITQERRELPSRNSWVIPGFLIP